MITRHLRVFVLAGIIFSLAFSVLSGSAVHVMAQGSNIVVVNTGAAHIRSGPAANTTSIGTVDGGSQLPVTGRNADTSWWRVTGNFGEGWVSAELVVFRGSLDTVPVVDNPAGTLETPTVIIDRFPATVYRNPDFKSFIIGIAPTGVILDVIGRSDDGNWWQVQTVMGAGWINAADVAFRGDETIVTRVGDPGPSFDGPTILVNTDTPVTTQPGGGDTIAMLSAGTALPATGRTADNTWWQVIGVFGIGWIPVNNVSLAGASDNIRLASNAMSPGPAYTGAAFATATVAVQRKVAYAKDGFTSAPMWDAMLGTVLGVVARSTDGLWLKVTDQRGFVGWMNFSGLDLQGSMAGLPVESTFVPATNVAVVNIHRLNIRSGPGAIYTSITSVPGGAALSVTGKHPTLPWLRVEGDFGVGWVRIMYIIFRGDWNAVPVVTEPEGVIEIPQAYLGTDQWVYSKPDLGFPTGQMLPGDAFYPILGWTSDFKWALIETPQGNVWIGSGQFEMRGTATNAPVIQ